jgi:hypothetical protein
MIIIEPYLKDLTAKYFAHLIFVKFWISLFSRICLVDAYRTFKSLPFKGKTPYLSLPITSIPSIAKDLAESPSVNIRVQEVAFRVPASFASSSFGIPNNLDFFIYCETSTV